MMFRSRVRFFVLLCGALRLAAADPDPIAKNAERATAEFTQRLEVATRELVAARERIAKEKAPVLKAMQTAEEQIMALGPEIAALESARAQADENRQGLQRTGFALQKNINYVNALARDSLKALQDGLLPGENARYAGKLASLAQQAEAAGQNPDTSAAMETAEFMLQRFREQLGGYIAKGEALVEESNQMVPGSFAFFGPEVFFQSQNGAVVGTVRTREGSAFPVTYPLPAWKPLSANPIFQGQPGTIFADPSGGKALRLRETTGTLYEHVDRGGPVAYILVGVGVFAFALALQKALELRKLTVDKPATVQRSLDSLFDSSPDEQRAKLNHLKGATRELFATGLRHLKKPKEALEEHLFAFTLRTRVHYERRLPLLAVIATASPLMGLLGTVMGMIKTFALITVFGTGNAAKLSSGISEVLVTTELGLIVAVPVLIAHGFLSHRAQKKLSLLERYAVEFVAAASDSRDAERAPLSL
ncbi:MAG: MotA/TolQ/ExbB proton channel family protein [Opitutus sp.]